ncbi:hypothetical protein ncot_18750 [Nocardioides sp. JQ2195]|uniref:hypothetical protein n=1 Tax=Nocardioides sp. JQ2195 TaxID=2592334 RepID=UPI00143EBD55|nr:hypothetical protein [Nocardioides sp. JQ2195]QIX28403.1 hypothetical protein ncot_18750 [Nocardioides sp. JQ2195]
MSVAFPEHVDLLDLHGRAAVASLGQLHPGDRVPPRDASAREVGDDHWATLEVWAWSLENPTGHWSARDAPDTPPDLAALVASIATQLDRLESVLSASGPDAAIDYFGEPGTFAQVARLLAHEAITVARAVSIAAGRQSPALSAAVAADGVDQALGHWESPEARATWLPATVAVRATDIEEAWHLQASRARVGTDPEIRLVPAVPADAVVEGRASDLLRWLHGFTDVGEAVTMSGDREALVVVRSALMHPAPQAPRRRRRWFR